MRASAIVFALAAVCGVGLNVGCLVASCVRHSDCGRALVCDAGACGEPSVAATEGSSGTGLPIDASSGAGAVGSGGPSPPTGPVSSANTTDGEPPDRDDQGDTPAGDRGPGTDDTGSSDSGSSDSGSSDTGSSDTGGSASACGSGSASGSDASDATSVGSTSSGETDPRGTTSDTNSAGTGSSSTDSSDDTAVFADGTPQQLGLPGTTTSAT